MSYLILCSILITMPLTSLAKRSGPENSNYKCSYKKVYKKEECSKKSINSFVSLPFQKSILKSYKATNTAPLKAKNHYKSFNKLDNHTRAPPNPLNS